MLKKVSFHFGQVIHHRYRPNNRFSYGVYYLRIPMRARRENPLLLSKSGISDNCFGLLSFFDRDHGIGELHSLDWIEKLLHDNHIQLGNGEVWLHTFPRFLGYVFNPVSFWFCHDEKNQLIAIVAEVNNTFGDRHAYLLQDNNQSLVWGKTLSTNKIFYVSPFFDVKGSYTFRFMRQEVESFARHVSRIDYFEDNEHVLMTSISGKEYPINFITRTRAFFRYPLLTFGVIVKIHWQALKLWIKGAKFYKKPSTSHT